MNMKKAIRLMALVLGILLFAGCSKTTMNEIVLSGQWELKKIETIKDGVTLEPYFPAMNGMQVLYIFGDNRYFEKIESSTTFIGAEKKEKGSWVVDGNELFISFLDGVERYHIENPGLLRLVLRASYVKDGHDYVDYLYLEK